LVFLYFTYFYKADTTSQNYTPEIMETCGLWQDIIATIKLVAFHADSNIYNLNNNFGKLCKLNSVMFEIICSILDKQSCNTNMRMIIIKTIKQYI
jgi:hypothetical protein